MEPVVVVLGGNAFVSSDEPMTMKGQFRFASQAAAVLQPLLTANVPLLISHGNGPQVGHILIRVEQALGEAYSIPLEVCVAESEGEIGYVLTQCLHNYLVDARTPRPVVGLVTQVVVSADDPAFANPTKPVGPFYAESRAEVLKREGLNLRLDAGRGYRRVVPSPRPIEVVEFDVIRDLVASGVIVVAGGGGGIPVIRDEGKLQGVEGVIDKDYTGTLLAKNLGSRLLVILTSVPCAYRDFLSDHRAPIGRATIQEARQLLAEGHFAEGSMRPKIEAAIDFANAGGTSVICDPPSLEKALKLEAGTRIVPDGDPSCLGQINL
ncbi:MAG: carbamate kinase [Planctomycetales bacterium]